MKGRLLIIVAVGFAASGCMSHLYISKRPDYAPVVGTKPGSAGTGTPIQAKPGNELATFSGGHFWNLEAKFREVPGVVATTVGYTGGETVDPNFREVSRGATGHAEAVLVEFDPKKVSYERLLVRFFQIHDPTTKNRQGEDVGYQFRSAVFHHSIEQRNAAAAMVRKLTAETGKKIFTYVAPAEPFFVAEPYYQQYLAKTGMLSKPDPNWRNEIAPPGVQTESSPISSNSVGIPPRLP
ncbi:MAG: peptide-methionine (S)-S-oxide reductase MsrA [Fimbriimonas sp.]